MPIPAVAIPWILGALGGGTLWAWVSSSDDEWAHADVFNSRMREIHTGILQLNNIIAKCGPITGKKSEIDAWRTFVTLWSQFYRDIGTVTFAPSSEVILEARHHASTLAKWLDIYKQLCGPLPSGLMPADTPAPNTKKPMHWSQLIIWAVVIATGGYVASNYLKSRKV